MFEFAAWFFGFRRDLARAHREHRPVTLRAQDPIFGMTRYSGLIERVGFFTVTVDVYDLEVGESALLSVVPWYDIVSIITRSLPLMALQLPSEEKASLGEAALGMSEDDDDGDVYAD